MLHTFTNCIRHPFAHFARSTTHPKSSTAGYRIETQVAISRRLSAAQSLWPKKTQRSLALAKQLQVSSWLCSSTLRQFIKVYLRHAIEVARRGHNGSMRVESTLNASRFYERYGFREVKRSTIKRNLVEVPIVVMEMPANPTVERDARKSGARTSL